MSDVEMSGADPRHSLKSPAQSDAQLNFSPQTEDTEAGTRGFLVDSY